MSLLKYKTRGNAYPQGEPRVYFCCHPEDFDGFFETIASEILEMQNCSIWYVDEAVDRGEDFLEDLKQMQLFVMPVTTRLLCTGNPAIDIEFPFAIENHIPVLPLMQESGLEALFNRKCGDLQFLDKYNIDTTAINYDEKLKKYLESVLIGDELAKKIRAAFDAYVFLSYRKKDRKYAQELMRLIHKNEFFRDIAIWYDEFLTPGENFNDSIKEALQKSGLFILAVTPNIVSETNYILTTEYPMAKQEGKPILPAEVVPTNREQLFEKYADIPEPTDVRNEVELSDALLSSFKKMAIKESDASPEHNFFIGLAYLGGIDVEVDYTRAIERITSAAEAGLPAAMEKLIDIYETGIGIAFDYTKAVFWQRRLHERLKKQLDIDTTTEKEVKKYCDVSFDLANNLKKMGFGDKAIAIKREYYDFFEAYKLRHCKDNQRALAEAYEELSAFHSGMASNERAKMYAEKAFSYFLDKSWECDKKTVWRFTGIARRLLRLCGEDESASVLEETKGIVEYVVGCVQASEGLTGDESICLLMDLYEDYAAILKEAKRYDAAKEYYMKSYAMIAEKIDFSQAIDRRLIEKLFSVLLGMKSLNRHEEKDSEAKENTLQMIDLRLKYIDSIERFEPEALRRMRMISEQYGEIVNQYRSVEKYSDALRYAEEHCGYLEKATMHSLTIEAAKLLEMAYYDLLTIYKRKERLSFELSDEEKQNRTRIIKKKIKILIFILEHHRKEQNTLFAINKMRDALTELIEAHLSLGETDAAIHYSEERLAIMLDRYEKTKFLSDAYFAYYDISDFYKKLERHDQAIAYFLLGLEYEEKEIKGNYSRDNQERLAYLYRKAGKDCFTTGASDKGYESLKKALQITIAIHKEYSDAKSAKALYYLLWDYSQCMEKEYPDSAALLRRKMAELEKQWHVF